MNNTKQIINNHKKRILNSSKHINDTTDNTNTKDTKNCSCPQNTCPLDRNCRQSPLIYQATLTCKDNSTTETYIRLTENDFKTRYRNHTASFQHTKHRNSTKLSKHIWTLKEKNIDHFISWRILSSRSPYNSASKRCNLCFKEKLLIICQPELSSLNKSNALVYCVTIEQSIEVYHKAYCVDFNNRCGYVYFVYYTYIYIYSLWYVYFGIYGNNRNPGDEKMAKKRKNALCIKTKLFILLRLKKEGERLYTNKRAL